MSLSVETYVLAKNYTDSVIDSSGAGVVPNITITAVQLEADEQPTVTKGGTNVNPTFELGIPKGKQGPAGKDAPQIDDTKITTANPWSSAKIVETVCPPFETSGPIVTCNPMAGTPLHVVSQIVPVQEGEGDPSPENVRPISGWTEANLLVGGRNLFDISKVENITGKTYHLLNNGDGTLSIKTPAGDSGVSTRKTLRDFVGDLPDGNYFLTAKTTGSGSMIYLGGVNVVWSFNKVRNLTSADLDSTVAFYASGPGTSAVISDIQIEPGSQASPYTPYNPASKTITLPFWQTVYGGTLNWTTGVLTIKNQKLIFDGSENWISGSGDNGYILGGSDAFVQNQIAVCNIAVPTAVTNLTGFHLRISYNFFRFQGFADKYPDAESFKAFLQTQNAEIAAELVTPITIQLTPQEILALSGVNTLYTDTGDTTVSGRADPTTIINQLAARIAALESAATNI